MIDQSRFILEWSHDETNRIHPTSMPPFCFCQLGTTEYIFALPNDLKIFEFQVKPVESSLKNISTLSHFCMSSIGILIWIYISDAFGEFINYSTEQ